MEIGWISAASYIIYSSNFFREVWENPHVNRFFMDIALIGIGFNITIMLYMTIYLPYIAKINEGLETHCPRLIPIITLVGVISFLL